MPSLFVIRGANQGNRYELSDETTTLGRESDNSIQLHDGEVSRRHARIEQTDDGFWIRDQKSSNGTFVNGVRVTEHRLQSGDQLQLGTTLILYTRPSDESTVSLRDKVAISSQPTEEEQSRILHSISHEEGSRIFSMQQDATAIPWLAEARSNLQVIYRTTLAVSRTLDIDQLLKRIMDLIFEWVAADRGCVMLHDREAKELEPHVRQTRDGSRDEQKITISRTILDYVLEHQEGVLTSNALRDKRWDSAASILSMGVREAICVPMRGRYDTVGVIYIDTLTAPQDLLQDGSGGKFNEDHLKLMIAIAHQAALAVEDTRYYRGMVQAERLAAIGQTIATLSHHIKNILQGIRGGSFLIEKGLAEHDESLISNGWTIVDKNQTKISQLVLDMLTYSKEREPDLRPSDLNEVVGDVVELMQSRAADLDVELRWAADDALPRFVFDPEGIHRAVTNLVTNAIDAVGGEPTRQVRVDVVADPDEPMARVFVVDTGPGIPEDEIASVFNPFVSSKGGHGTGLGLPVSQKILNEHGGRIVVESQPGKGSRFTVELPIMELGPENDQEEGGDVA